MINRREVLKLGAVASVLSAAGNVAATTLASSTKAVIAVVDLRHIAAQGFAEGAEAYGYDVHALRNGDITPFWYHHLAGIWQQAPVTVVGMTAHGPFFCLQQLAAQYGLQVKQCELLPEIISKEPLYSWMIMPRIV